MKDSLSRMIKAGKCFELYYVLVIAGYVLTLFIEGFRPGVLASGLMALVIVELILKKRLNIHSVMDVLIVVYFLYRALTIICIINVGMPLNIYTGEFVVSLLPMVFYFAGRSEETKDSGFYRKLLIALILLGIISFVLYAFAPSFYCEYLYRWVYISKADAATARVRMQSVTGSTVFGAIMTLGMCASLFFLGKSGTSKEDRKDRIFGTVSLIVTFVFAILSNQRSCMVVCVLILVYVNYLIFARFDSIPKKYLIYEIVGIVVVVAAIAVLKFDFILKIWWRVESLPGAVSQRSEQWVAAVNNMYSSWFGNGLGANGHRAVGIEGAHVIADGGLIKMYCEEGVLGFSLFVYILFLSIKKAVVNISESYAEIAVIFASLLLSIGSNVLCFQLVTPLFWFAIGRIFIKVSGDELINCKKTREIQK